MSAIWLKTYARSQCKLLKVRTSIIKFRSTSIDNWEMLSSLHVSDELLKLAEEGFSRYIDKTEMENDKILEPHKCFFCPS